jgi:hypothetical protein
VTRIESQTLKLNKERFDLDEVISSLVGDYRSILFDDEDKDNLFDDEDKDNLFDDEDKDNLFGITSKYVTFGRLLLLAQDDNSRAFLLIT